MNRKVNLLYFFLGLCAISFLLMNTCRAGIKPSLLAKHDLKPEVYELALKAQTNAIKAGEINNPNILTVIDYSRPSYEKRLWVIDVKRQAVLFHTYVSHGVASGQAKPSQFSNVSGSKQSSIGAFSTGKTYVGKHGRSLHLHGLEKGINSNAYQRHIVVHGASYVGEQQARAKHVGRSHGCPAVSYQLAQPIIDQIKDGSMLFIYYPDDAWLGSSKYV